MSKRSGPTAKLTSNKQQSDGRKVSLKTKDRSKQRHNPNVVHNGRVTRKA